MLARWCRLTCESTRAAIATARRILTSGSSMCTVHWWPEKLPERPWPCCCWYISPGSRPPQNRSTQPQSKLELLQVSKFARNSNNNTESQPSLILLRFMDVQYSSRQLSITGFAQGASNQKARNTCRHRVLGWLVDKVHVRKKLISCSVCWPGTAGGLKEQASSLSNHLTLPPDFSFPFPSLADGG